MLYLTTGIEISFDLHARDVLLIYFFAGIGLNSDLRSLLSGGIPLIIPLCATIGLMFLQNITGVGVATLFNLNGAVGVLGGTTSLIGGHGTAIAWTPVYIERYGITNASEIGIACATFGLVLASLMGGPIANILIPRHKLEPEKMHTTPFRPHPCRRAHQGGHVFHSQRLVDTQPMPDPRRCDPRMS